MSAEASTLARSRPDIAPAARPADDVDWLIDNADAYRALVAAIRDARSTIWISQLALDADCVAYDAGGEERDDVRFVDELVAAARRGIAVRVLLNASLLLDTAKPLRSHLAERGADPRLIRVRGVRRFPQLLHAKMVIVDDDSAFLVGSPFANGYWDDDRHAPADARRPMRELGGRPVHDVSMRLTGSPVASLRAIFADLWNEAEDVHPDDVGILHTTTTGPRLATELPMMVVRTAPGNGPMEILPALLDGIDDARSLIYIEHQYLSARVVVDALVRALARHRELEIVIVLNQNPDVTAYRGWQNERFVESGLREHPRVGVFSLWTSAKQGNGRRQISQLFVHSKVVAIDDRWAMLGSANLDGVSLHSYGADFSSRLGRRIFRGVRNFDVNVVFADRGDGELTGQVRNLRVRLWREHLGPSFHEPGARPAAGWLPLWRSIADRNARALRRLNGSSNLDRSFVLPYSARSTPRAQLADMGVLLAPEVIELCFEPSWLEVHCSPNWVRNMFG